MGKTFLVLGGSRSGKSQFAEELAARLGQDVVYIATAEPRDEEMVARVAEHRSRRPVEWVTVEEKLDLVNAIKLHDGPGRIFLIDCLTVWLSNLLLETDSFNDGDPGKDGFSKGESYKEELLAANRVEELAQVALEAKAAIILVSGEVGMGLVPPYPLGRLFRDVAGRANRVLAGRLDRVFLVVAGLPLDIKKMAIDVADMDL